MVQARGFFKRALNLDPENIETLVGIALVDATMGAASLSDTFTLTNGTLVENDGDLHERDVKTVKRKML